MNITCQTVRLTADPELKYTQNGKSVCTFSGAYNEKYNDKETVSFFNYVAWGKTGETINQYFKKGQQIVIVSKAQQKRWEDQNGNKRSTIEFVVISFDFTDRPKHEEHPGSVNDATPAQPFDSEGIPF